MDADNAVRSSALLATGVGSAALACACPGVRLPEIRKVHGAYRSCVSPTRRTREAHAASSVRLPHIRKRQRSCHLNRSRFWHANLECKA